MIHPLWYLCIATRLFLAYSLIEYQKYSKYIKLIILIIGLGFGYKALTGSNNEIQFRKVFWHKTRWIHSIFFILAYLTPSLKLSTAFLVSDVIFSIIYRTYLEIR
jgi:hypothetical protein